MRCALKWDENIPLIKQKLSAWGEMQSLDENPEYKEEDIKEQSAKDFFCGYKCAMDDICNILENLEGFGLKKKHTEKILKLLPGEICMQLFSILDDEVE